MLYRISSKGKETIDGSQLASLSVSSVQSAVRVRTDNGDLYHVADGRQVWEERALFHLHVHGMLTQFDTHFLQQVLKHAWGNILTGCWHYLSLIHIIQNSSYILYKIRYLFWVFILEVLKLIFD